MLLDEFSKAPKFVSQMIMVYILSGKYLWLLYLASFLTLNLCAKRSVKKYFYARLCLGLGKSMVFGMVAVQLTKQLQRPKSCFSKSLARIPL